MGEALAMVSLVLFSANVLVVKVATPRLAQHLGFLVALGTNVLFAALLLTGQRLASDVPFELDWRAIVLFCASGLFGTYAGRRLLFRAVEHIGSARASALQVTSPVFAAVLGWIFLGETLGPTALLAGVAVLAGMLLTSLVPASRGGPPLSPESVPMEVPDGAPPTGAPAVRTLPATEIGLAVGGAFCYAIGNVLRSTGGRLWDEAILGGFLGAVAGASAYLLIHVKLTRVRRDLAAADRRGIALWVASGMLTITAQICLIAATRTIPVAVGVVISTAMPVIVIPAGYLLFHNSESITGRTVAGAGLILVGVATLLLI